MYVFDLFPSLSVSHYASPFTYLPFPTDYPPSSAGGGGGVLPKEPGPTPAFILLKLECLVASTARSPVRLGFCKAHDFIWNLSAAI